MDQKSFKQTIKGPGDDEDIYIHESYGMAGLSRRTHGGGPCRLFGSAFEDVPFTMALTICHRVCKHSLVHGWFHRCCAQPIIETEFSPAQFAEFVTNPNVGDGVLCTIRSIDGKAMERPPGRR